MYVFQYSVCMYTSKGRVVTVVSINFNRKLYVGVHTDIAVFKYTDADVDILRDTYLALERHPLIRNPGEDDIVSFWRNVENAASMYQLLSQLAIAICLTPHSNATAERVKG